MRVLITGGSGTLGSELKKVFPEHYAPTHIEMDIGYKSGVAWQLVTYRPDVIIHCAALTTIRACDERREVAYDYNVIGTRNMIEMASRYCPEAKFIHISTPCIFDGKHGPYSEADSPKAHPSNYYGWTKYWAEQEVWDNCNTKNFPLLIRCNFVARKPWPFVRAFTDRFGTYLFADDLAKAISENIEKDGILHIVGDQRMSMYELAKLTKPDVQEMTIADYQGPPLTMDMSMTSNRIKPYKLTV